MHTSISARRRLRSAALAGLASPVMEQLETRTLLAADPAQIILQGGVPGEVVAMHWKGKQVQAIGGEYLLGFKAPAATYDEDGELVSRNVRYTAPNQKASPALTAALAKLGTGIRFDSYVGVEHLIKITAPRNVSFEQIRSAVSTLQNFEYVEPNFVYSGSSMPNDPKFGDQWAMNNTGQVYFGSSQSGTAGADIDAPQAWDVTRGSSSVVVAVLDTGMNYNHPDLAPNAWKNRWELNGTTGVDDDGSEFVDDIYGWDFVNNDANPMDDHGHGTQMAGTIGAKGNNELYGAGVNWDAQILPVKVLGSDKKGTAANIIAGINYVGKLRDNGVNIRVINSSWIGGAGEDALRTAIVEAGTRNIVFVVPSGHLGVNATYKDGSPNLQPGGWDLDVPGWDLYPAAYKLPNMIVVTGTNDDDQWHGDQNYGDETVNMAAPAWYNWTTSWSASEPDGFAVSGGSSYAAAQVSGAAAMAFAIKPEASYQYVKTAIIDSGDALPDLVTRTISGKRLNLNSMLTMVGAPSMVVNGDLNGTATNDTIIVRRKVGDNSKVEVLINNVQQTMLVGGTEYTEIPYNLLTSIAVHGLGGNDNITISTDFTIGVSVLGGLGDDTISGGGGNDTLGGGQGYDSILGNAGNDSLTGGQAGDTLGGGAGEDYINGALGHDSQIGGNGYDSMYGNEGNDTMFGGAANDMMYGDIGNDYMDGGDGEDHLDGGGGTDTLLGGAGNDYFYAIDLTYDSISGGDGNDSGDVDLIHDLGAGLELLLG